MLIVSKSFKKERHERLILNKRKELKMIKTESGRSMVEMLGVLAIIGVLSVGGIAGYTMAMNKYRANEILNAVALVSVEATVTEDSTKTYTHLIGAMPSAINSYVTEITVDPTAKKATLTPGTAGCTSSTEPCKSVIGKKVGEFTVS